MYYNGKYYEFTENSEDQPYDHRAYLVHRNGQTVLMIQHSEYDHDYLDSYRLSGAEVIHAQWMEAGIDYIPFDEMIWGIENVFPAYVPADPGSIPVRRYLYTEAGDSETGTLCVEADGAFTVIWGE